MEKKVLYEIVKKNEKQFNGGPHALPDAPKGFGTRHTQSLLLFICITVGYALRGNLSVSMVAMTSHAFDDDGCLPEGLNDTNSIAELNGTDSLAELYKTIIVAESINSSHLVADQSVNKTHSFFNGTDGINKTVVVKNVVKKRHCERKQPSGWRVHRTYAWPKSTQEMILFSFFVGYTSMQLPMGYLAHKFGGKVPIMMALLVNGLISLLTPWLPIFGGWLALCGGRLIQGMAQAAFFPSIHSMLAKWAPLSERGRLSTYVYSGAHFGTIVIFQASGYFAGSSFGWPATFWFTGVASLASFALLWGLGASSPHDHPDISAEEMTFILEGGNADVVPKKRRTPWKHILTSRAVWALVAAHSGSATAYILLLTQSPTYMNYVLGVEIKKNGLFSSLPYVGMVIVSLFCGWAADLLANKNILTVVNIRRIACTLGMAVSGLFLIVFGYARSTLLAVALLVITLALHSAVHVGHHINQIDLAPNFAGNIMALGNMVANLTSLLVPIVVSNVVRDDMKNPQRWQIVFFIFVGLQCVMNAIFLVFCKGSVQSWNFYGEDESDTEQIDKISAKSALLSGERQLRAEIPGQVLCRPPRSVLDH